MADGDGVGCRLVAPLSAPGAVNSVNYRPFTVTGIRSMFVVAVLRSLVLCSLGWAGLVAAQDRPPPDTLGQRLQACVACHGAQDQATGDGYLPRIAGKPTGYLYNQLRHFREGRRKHPAMLYMVRHLSDAYLQEIAGYFSAQPVAHGAMVAEGSAADRARGEQLMRHGDPGRKLPACMACHDTSLLGMEPAIPGLLGLPSAYLYAQFSNWNHGVRQAAKPDCMAQIAKTLRPDEVVAVVAWLTAQPVPPQAVPAKPSTKPLPLDCGSLP